MLETIRRQLDLSEQAWNESRLRDAVEALDGARTRILEQARAWIDDTSRDLEVQIDRLADIGLVVSDLDAKMAKVKAEEDPVEATAILEQVQHQVVEMVDLSGKLLLRTNIFERGKRTFLSFEPEETLGSIGDRLKARYRDQIVAHFAGRGVHVAVPEALEIVFFGALVWERPDEAVLSEHERVSDIIAKEPEGLIWFPVLPGDAPSLFGLDNEEDEASAMSILENFTVEADLNRLEDDMKRVAEHLETAPASSPPDESSAPGAQAVLVRGHGTSREERIPLVGSRISIGRGRDTDIQILNDARVSRHHCHILRDGDTFHIEDNSSSNGTTVDGEPIRRARLEGGEVIGVGGTEFLFLWR